MALCVMLTVLPMTALAADGTEPTADSHSEYALEIEAPQTLRVNQVATDVSVRLYTTVESSTGYDSVRINVKVDGPEGAAPKFMATDAGSGTTWNVLDFGYFGPETGFPVAADYDMTTNFTEVRFDKAGTYTVTLELVDCADDDAVLATETAEVEVVYPYTLNVTAPQTLRVDQACDSVQVQLTAADAQSETYNNARVNIVEVEAPEEAKPQFIAKDASSGQEWNVLDFGYFGPETGFPIAAGYDVTTSFTKVIFDKAGTYTYQLNLVDMANGEQVLATETISIEVTYPFAFEVNAPKSMRVDQENTNTSVRLYAVDGNDQAYTNALITIQVDGPEGAKPQFIAKDGDTEWNVLDFGYFGPETGFPVTADYDVTTNFAKVSFDKTGTYTVTLALVDKNNQDLVLAESINTISVTNRSSGGSGNATSRYDIEVAQTQNGTVKVRSNRVAEGSTVTITTTPDEGYALTGLKVTDQSSKEVTLTDKGDGVYTFTMPASDVTVKADFAQGSDLPFTDVAVNDWFYSAVRYMYENGCMNGLTDTTFGPDATTTRGMIVTMLYRHENEPTVAGENPFADVESTQYYADAINWAAANNIVTGYDETTFGPEDTITRAQMATILYRYAQYKGYDTTQGGMAVREFADYAEISDWSMTAVTWAVNADLLNGRSDNTLDPNGNATRAEVATILMRFCETFVK